MDGFASGRVRWFHDGAFILDRPDLILGADHLPLRSRPGGEDGMKPAFSFDRANGLFGFRYQ